MMEVYSPISSNSVRYDLIYKNIQVTDCVYSSPCRRMEELHQ